MKYSPIYTPVDELNAEVLLRAYANGLFPMAENSESKHVFWCDPEYRGVMPIEEFHVPKRLMPRFKNFIKEPDYRILVNKNFEQVMLECARSVKGREETWISQGIIDAYTALFEKGYAHCLEVWQEDQLIGGIYGVHLGSAFFGESMFSRGKDGSKIALTHLTARLWAQGFQIFDTQFVNPHIERFGCFEMRKQDYKLRLASAVKLRKSMLSDFSEKPAIKPKFNLKESFQKLLKPQNAYSSCVSAWDSFSSEEELLSKFLQSITQIS